jgi:hypothetical protein
MKHFAPKGAWVDLYCLGSINISLLTERKTADALQCEALYRKARALPHIGQLEPGNQLTVTGS